MIRNQSIPAPSDMPPVEMVSPPIDWSCFMTIENVFIAGLVLLIIPVIWSEYLTCKEFWKDD